MPKNLNDGNCFSFIDRGALAALCLIVGLIGFMISPYSKFYGSLLAISGIVLFILILIHMAFVRPSSARKEEMLERWKEFKKTGHLIINESLNLEDAEKIILGIAPCYMETFSGGFKYFVRDIIVTNQRIAIGFPVAIFFLPIKESFGSANIWYSASPKQHARPEMALLGVDLVAISAEATQKDGENILIIEAKYGPLKIDYRIYHPKAAQIEELYLKANGRSRKTPSRIADAL